MSSENPELQLAHAFAGETGCNIFLTGRAGTGKTTFLHDLRRTCSKRMIVTAPTGVAAINAGGVTLHSFFQLPFGPFVPGHSGEEQKRYRFNKEKIKIIRSLDLLVIDEISMVRADLLDGVDAVLRRYRHRDEPFGGVQLLMIGDLHQLPPVVKDEEWELLRNHYKTFYFFGSNALRQTELVTVELMHIYRQADPAFIELLNRVRNNDLDDSVLAELNRRHLPDFDCAGENAITLSTHNRQADTINSERLSSLAGKTQTFGASVDGEFPEYSYPAPDRLELKEGAQVMFVRNDQSPDKLYYNGRIGTVTRVSAGTVRVRCPGDSEDIIVEPVEWENIRFKVDTETKEISRKRIGVFRQYPLKLAWAITIHKSQGLTFEKAVIDAGSAFAHGQVYVALSRCKTLDGLVLSRPLTRQAIRTDPVVAEFSGTVVRNTPTRARLEAARHEYQQRLILECFDFQALRSRLNWLGRLLSRYAGIVHLPGNPDVQGMTARAMEEVVEVSLRFQQELRGLFCEGVLPAADPYIRERLAKGSAYFQERMTALRDFFLGFSFETDNKEVDKQLRQALERLQKEILVKEAAVASCKDGFTVTTYLRNISAAEIDFKPARKKKARPVQYTEEDVGHPELFEELRSWRSERAAEEDVPHYRVLHQKVLIQIAVNLPDSLPELMRIKGIGPRLAEKYGSDIVELVADYRKRHAITEVTLPGS